MSNTFRQKLAAGTVTTTTVYDMMAAKIAQQAGFDAVMCSGYGHAASVYGMPDNGSLTLEAVRNRVATMARIVDIPVLVDADTGFDDPALTMRMLADAGAQAVMIEDQLPAKTCGHSPGKGVVPIDEMRRRLEALLGARPAHVAVIARTDAAQVNGIDDAIKRGRMFAELGVDVVFVEAPVSYADVVRIPKEIPCATMLDLMPGGVTPILSAPEVFALGFRVLIYGLPDLMFAAEAVSRGFRELITTGDLRKVKTPLMNFAELGRLTGLERSTAPQGSQ